MTLFSAVGRWLIVGHADEVFVKAHTVDGKVA